MAEFIDAGDDYRNPGEQRAIDVVNTLPDDWLVIANKTVPLRHGRSWEIDLIVVGPHRVMLLDEKSWWGKITGSDEIWTLADGAQRDSPLKKIDFRAKEIGGWLRERVAGFPDGNARAMPVVGGVILSNPGASAQIGDARARRGLLHLANARDGLIWLDEEGRGAGFDLAPLRDAIRRLLFNKDESRAPKRPRSMGIYTITEELDARDGCRVFIGERENGGRRVLYVYENTAGADGFHAEIDRNLEALQRLQSTGVVPAVHEPFLWNDDQFRVIPVDEPSGRALNSLPRPRSETDAVREIERAAAAFDALAKIHATKTVHRAISPDVVHITESDADAAPKVMISRFIAARLDLAQTITPRLNAGGFGDPFAAPEIARIGSYELADEHSDVYSLGLATASRLTSLTIEQIKTAMERDGRLPHNPDGWPYLPESAIAPLEHAFNSALNAGAYQNQTRSTARDLAAALTGIARDARAAAPWKRGDEVGGQDRKYRIEKFLGSGASARTYLVYDHGAEMICTGKSFLRRASKDALQEAVREFRVLFDHPNKHLPRLTGINVTDPCFQVLLEYIDGETLRARLSKVKHNRNAWANVAEGLLNAGVHLESHGILHRDIKPDNVMIREADDRVFLIDYGTSANAAAGEPLAGTPRYWPPEWRTSQSQPDSCDRYAIAVTLFEALTGALPFKNEGAAFSAEPLDTPPDNLPAELRDIATILLREVAVNRDERRQTMTELQHEVKLALQRESRPESVAIEPPVHATPAARRVSAEQWIDGLRSLFRNSRRGNADNRGLDTAFARDTYVETALDLALWPLAQAQRPAAIFLSGNPGDGKTAFLERVRDDLVGAGAAIVDPTDRSGWEARVGGHAYRACFDASESANGLSADEQLAQRLAGHEGDHPAANLTVVVAINDGRLAEMQDRFPERFPWLSAEMERALEERGTNAAADRKVWVVDLKQRSYVALRPGSEPSVMRQMLATMVDDSRWAGAPVALDVLSANAAALRSDAPDAPAERLERLLLLAHLRGERHTTVRDLRSALSLIITGDLSKDDFKRADPDMLPYPWSGKYWNTIFSTPEARDLVLGQLKSLDPARFAHPALERFLFFRHGPEYADERARLFANGQDEPPPAGDDPAMLTDWIAAVKRRFVLEGVPTRIAGVEIRPWDLLPYHAADDFIALLANDGDGANLLPKLLRGIGRSDGIAEAMRTNQLLLIVKRSDEYDIEMVKSFPAGEFALTANQPVGQQLVETQPRTLRLRHEKSGAFVHLNLDLVELLVRLADGLDPASAELKSLLEELGPFKSRLQRSSSDRLLVIEGPRRHWLIKDGEKIVRHDA